MRGWFLFAVIIVGYAQPSLILHYADSLAQYGTPAEALALYDSVLSVEGLPDSLRLRACRGSLRPLIALGAWDVLLSRIDSAQSLALRLKDTLSYVETLAAQAVHLISQGSYEVAETTLHKALALLGEHSRHSEVYALLLYRLAVLHHLRGDYSQAEAQYQQARTAYAEIVGINHPGYTLTTYNLATLYREEGRYAEAETLCLEAKAIQTRILGTRHPAYLQTLNNLAII